MTTRRRAGVPEEPAPVTWRDGVHLTGTVLWCDARRARDVCFVSSADRIGRAGHGQLIGTRETLAQVTATPAERLSVPLLRPFTLGTVRLELLPSGYAVGAAMLSVEHGSARTLYAGPIAPGGVGLGGAAAARECDVLVVAAPYGRREHVFMPPTKGRAATVAFAEQAIADGNVAVLLVTNAAHGLDVAAALNTAGIRCAAHRTLHDLTRRLRTAGAAVPAISGQVARVGAALIWPVSDERGRHAVLSGKPTQTALISGRAVEPGAISAAAADHGIAWSSSADRAQLLEFVERSKARRVYFTDSCADELRQAVGARAQVLAPPKQLALWSAG